MPQIILDLRDFVLCFFSNWLGFVGGTGSFLIAITEKVNGRPMRRRAYFFVVFGVFSLLAVFSIWRKEHRLILQVDHIADIRDNLGAYLSIDLRIQNQCKGAEEVYPGLGPLEAYKRFHSEIHTYVRNEMGYSYGEQLVDSLNYGDKAPSGLSGENAKAWILAEGTRHRINELMAILDGRTGGIEGSVTASNRML